MGFLNIHAGVESWLQGASAQFAAFSQKEYREIVASWRARFEEILISGAYLVGRSAECAALDELPVDAVVFCIPGYRWLPAGTDARFGSAYGYQVTQLADIDFVAANAADAVIADKALSFTCLCTHEAGSFARVQFCQTR